MNRNLIVTFVVCFWVEIPIWWSLSSAFWKASKFVCPFHFFTKINKTLCIKCMHCIRYRVGQSVRLQPRGLPDSTIGLTLSNSLTSVFRSQRYFHKYCNNFCKVRLIVDGWMRVSVHLNLCPTNRTGCYRCLLELLKEISSKFGGSERIILFKNVLRHVIVLCFLLHGIARFLRATYKVSPIAMS